MAVRGDGRRHTEDGRQLGPRSDLASDEHVAVADVRPARLAAHDRRVCIEHDAPPLFLPHDAQAMQRVSPSPSS